jgi:hypothetical protein
LQGLKNGAVLTVGGYDVDAVLLQEGHNGRAAADQSLLVREGDGLACLGGRREGGVGRGKGGEEGGGTGGSVT